MSAIAIYISDKENEAAALALSHQLQIPIFLDENKIAPETEYVLTFRRGCLYLSLPKTPHFKPLAFDFMCKKFLHRLAHANKKSELLLSALGRNPDKTFTILDATAGTGHDAFIMAKQGYQLTLCENSPLIYALLQNALERAAYHPILSPIVQRIKLYFISNEKMLTHNHTYHIVYLDPMFPPTNKSAASKKAMQIFQMLLPTSTLVDETVFDLAFSCAISRVVVKRPRIGMAISAKQVSWSIIGKSNRFDIYHKI